MNMKTIKALILALCMLCCMAAFAACGEQTSQPSGENTPADASSAYRVTVVDAFGEPVTDGVIVRFMQDGKQASMQVVGKDGTASKELEAGTYTAELKFTDEDAAYYYDPSNVTLTSENRELEIILYNALPSEPQSLYAPSLKGDSRDFEAYPVTVGGTYVELEPGERNYFLFAPTEAGTYEITVQNCDAVVGYYGAPHFVQQMSAAETVDNVLTMSIRASMIGTNGTGTTVLVLGLDAPEGQTSGILTVRRTGEPQWSVEDEPWHVYRATHELAPFTTPAGTLKSFDLKASSDAYNLVLDSKGFYHLDSADGPLVVVKLGAASGGSPYLPAFETILERSGITKYFYDEAGNFVKKESYSECLLEYIACMDEESGLYPLTEDLKYIIQMRGDHYGWFDTGKGGYIFLDGNGNPISDINHDISWLFMCGYLEN